MYKCIDCNTLISKRAKRCNHCARKQNINSYSLLMKKRWQHKVYRDKMSTMIKNKWNTSEYRDKVLEARKNYKMPLSQKLKIADSVRKVWRNKDYKEKVMRKVLKSLRNRPSSFEKQLIIFFQEEKIPYKYVGDGDLWIGGKNPDFVNNNGEKKLIEVFNNYHHPVNYVEKRDTHFSNYGYKTFFINETMIKSSNWKEQVLEVLKYGNK